MRWVRHDRIGVVSETTLELDGSFTHRWREVPLVIFELVEDSFAEAACASEPEPWSPSFIDDDGTPVFVLE